MFTDFIDLDLKKENKRRVDKIMLYSEKQSYDISSPLSTHPYQEIVVYALKLLSGAYKGTTADTKMRVKTVNKSLLLDNFFVEDLLDLLYSQEIESKLHAYFKTMPTPERGQLSLFSTFLSQVCFIPTPPQPVQITLWTQVSTISFT